MTCGAAAWSTNCVRCSSGICSGRGEVSLCLHWQPELQRHPRCSGSESPGWQQGWAASVDTAEGDNSGQQPQRSAVAESLCSETARSVCDAQEHAVASSPCNGSKAASNQTSVLDRRAKRFTSNLVTVLLQGQLPKRSIGLIDRTTTQLDPKNPSKWILIPPSSNVDCYQFAFQQSQWRCYVSERRPLPFGMFPSYVYAAGVRPGTDRWGRQSHPPDRLPARGALVNPGPRRGLAFHQDRW